MSAMKKSQPPSLGAHAAAGHHLPGQHDQDKDSGLLLALDDAVKFAATYRKGRDMSRDQSDIRQVCGDE